MNDYAKLELELPRRKKLLTTPEKSRLMSKVKQSGTSAELAVRRIVSELGFKFETNCSSLPGSPDLANLEHKWVVFVNGCFWHAHEACKRWRIPKTNQDFWVRKFESNRDRDRRNIKALEELGYSVLVVWECEMVNRTCLRGKLADHLGDALAMGRKDE